MILNKVKSVGYCLYIINKKTVFKKYSFFIANKYVNITLNFKNKISKKTYHKLKKLIIKYYNYKLFIKREQMTYLELDIKTE